MTIGSRVRLLRSNLKLSGEELAKKAGITQPYLSEIERDVKKPSMSVLQSIARNLQTTVSYLMGETGEPNRPESNVDMSTIKEVVPIPLLDATAVACAGFGNGGMEGIMLEASETILVTLDELGTIGEHKPYAIRVEGESMVEAGIPDGARIAINPEEEVFNGDSVLVKWGRRGDVAVKWFYEYEDRIELRSSNPAKYPPIIVSKAEIAAEIEAGNTDYFRICGKVMIVSMKPKRGI